MAVRDRLTFHEVDRRRWVDLERLFEGRGGPRHCWCMVWRATPQERRRFDSRASRKAALSRRVRQGVPVPVFKTAGFREVGRAGTRRHVMRLTVG